MTLVSCISFANAGLAVVNQDTVRVQDIATSNTTLRFCTSIKDLACEGQGRVFSDLDDVWLHIESEHLDDVGGLEIELVEHDVVDGSPKNTTSISMEIAEGSKITYIQLDELSVTNYSVTVLSGSKVIASGEFSIFSEAN